jgi:AcrR family transcriptional regulator
MAKRGALMENTVERPSRQSAHLARQRKLFITAAQHTLAESGLTATIEEFAATAGVTVATLYNHFPTKETLIRIAFTEAQQEWEKWMVATVSGLEDPAERLVCSFRLFLRIPTTHVEFARLAAVAAMAGSPMNMASGHNAILEIEELNRLKNRVLALPMKRVQSFFAAIAAELQQQGLAVDVLAADFVIELLLPILGFSEKDAHDLVGKALPAL